MWARLTRNSEVSVKSGSLVTVFTVDLWLPSVSRGPSFGNVSTRLFSRADCVLIRSVPQHLFYLQRKGKETSRRQPKGLARGLLVMVAAGKRGWFVDGQNQEELRCGS